MTPEDEYDEVDGMAQHPVRELALKLIRRDPEELTDAEHLMQQSELYWWQGYCLETFHTTHRQVDSWLLCSEYTEIRAASVVGDAYRRMAKKKKAYFTDS